MNLLVWKKFLFKQLFNQIGQQIVHILNTKNVIMRLTNIVMYYFTTEKLLFFMWKDWCEIGLILSLQDVVPAGWSYSEGHPVPVRLSLDQLWRPLLWQTPSDTPNSGQCPNLLPNRIRSSVGNIFHLFVIFTLQL